MQSSKIYSSQAKTQTKLPVLSSLKQKTVYKICIFRQIIFFHLSNYNALDGYIYWIFICNLILKISYLFFEYSTSILFVILPPLFYLYYFQNYWNFISSADAENLDHKLFFLILQDMLLLIYNWIMKTKILQTNGIKFNSKTY